MPSSDQYRDLARLKLQGRLSDVELAAHFGVSLRTVQRWLHDTAFAQYRTEFQTTQRDAARTQIAGLADEIIDTLRDVMLNSRSDHNRVMAATQLGKWLGLDTLVDPHEEDAGAEVVELLRQIAAAPKPLQFLPPPLPGGALPDYVDAVIVPTTEEAPLPEKREGGEDGKMVAGENQAGDETAARS